MDHDKPTSALLLTNKGAWPDPLAGIAVCFAWLFVVYISWLHSSFRSLVLEICVMRVAKQGLGECFILEPGGGSKGV